MKQAMPTPFRIHHSVALGIPIATALTLSLTALYLAPSPQPQAQETPLTNTPAEPNLPPASFEECFLELLMAEGGYSEHPNDPGGATKFGMSIREVRRLDADRKLPAFLRNLLDADRNLRIDEDDVNLWSRETARVFYKTFYWDPIRADELPAIWGRIVFDSAVNEGVQTAVKHLQRTIFVKPDGVVGPETLKAARNAAASDISQHYVAQITAIRLDRYRKLKNANDFFVGWAQRAVRLALAVSA